MRSVSLFSLIACGALLAGCAGTSSSSGTLAAGLDVCGIGCTPTSGGGSGSTPDPNDLDGDGLPDGTGDTDGTTGSGAGGNNTSLTSGGTAITLEGGTQQQAEGGKGFIRLTSANNTTHNATVASILSNNKPTTMQFEIDTKTDSNKTWAKPTMMTEYKPGTRETGWVKRGHYDTAVQVRNAAGTIVAIYDPNYTNTARYSVQEGGFVRTNAAGVPLTVDNDNDGNADLETDGDELHVSADYLFDNEFYAEQVRDVSRANGGAGTNYREYRVYSDSKNRDEELQVWAWDDSYAVQYRNAIGGGGPAKQQAWAFGGNATANMPTSGSATYNGRFVGNAKTENWVNPDGSTIDPNSIWMVEGSSRITANFGNGRVNGTLSPETWESFQNGNWYMFSTDDAQHPNLEDVTPRTIRNTGTEPYFSFYDEDITLAGTITGNTYSGTASFSDEYLMGDNVMQGGLFGNGASETAGVFAADGTSPDPFGGSTGIEGDRRGFLKMNGAFHGER